MPMKDKWQMVYFNKNQRIIEKSMGEFLKSNDYLRPIFKHIDLPVYKTDEFDFFRCIEFDDNFYGKTVSVLHSGNLRKCEGRYSKLFPNQRISYWADSPVTSRAEIKKHGASNNIITFWAYDDATSTIPITDSEEQLVIVDGRKCGVQDIIDKIDKGRLLSKGEEEHMNQILQQNPDCLVYDSRAYSGGENYIFLEKGFKKLVLRQVSLRLGSRKTKNTQKIICSQSCDYSPIIKNYGCCFNPIAKIGFCEEYLESEEYMLYSENRAKSLERLRKYYED